MNFCDIKLKKDMIKIHVTSVPVDNQDKALKFYTEKLGFVKKTEVPMGEYKWLTVVSPGEQNGVELLLEPMAFEPAKIYQKALKDAGIPYTSFMVADVIKEYDRLIGLGIKFSMEPRDIGPVKIAILDDTRGNNIQLVQML
jgi:catechol 2,3-dioxygenase-like lactoylglutathione lyase family enzyme